MLLLRTFALWLLLAFLGQQVSVSSGGRVADKAMSPAHGRAQRSGDKGSAIARGKFPTKEMKCTWSAKDVGDKVKIRVHCENPEARIKGGETDLSCDYNGKPQGCLGYQSDSKGFWKQVARGFKRLQGKACRDVRALVRAGMCKGAPRVAHFKLDIASSVISAQSGGDYDETLTPPPPPRPTSTTTSTSTAETNCTRRADLQKKGEEYCSSAWASVCTLFFSMLQGDDC